MKVFEGPKFQMILINFFSIVSNILIGISSIHNQVYVLLSNIMVVIHILTITYDGRSHISRRVNPQPSIYTITFILQIVLKTTLNSSRKLNINGLSALKAQRRRPFNIFGQRRT